MLLYANFLLMFGLALNINTALIIGIATVLFPAYLLIGISGYFLNDLFDIKADNIANKFNITQIIDKYLVLLLILFSSALGFYLIYSISREASLILLFQFIFLIAYSIPVIRLKEKGILGLITDALYAHVIPAIILLILLQKYAYIPFQIWISCIVFCSLLGLRDIVLHQNNDVEKDLKSKTQTFAINNLKSMSTIIQKLNVFSAIAMWILLLLLYILTYSILLLVLLIILIISHLIHFYKYKTLPRDTLIRNYILISSIIFMYLIIESRFFSGIIMLAHPYSIQKVKSLSNWICVTLIPLIFNYCLYAFFLLLGRNLKKRPLFKSQQ